MLPKAHYAIHKTKLPSGQTVQFRPMLGGEEKILLMAKESDDSKEILSTVMQVVKNCLIDTDVTEMPIFDVEWVFIQIRIVSVGAVCPVSYVDRSDGKRYDFDVDLRQVEVTEVASVDDVIKVNDQVGLKLRYPSALSFISPVVTALESDALIAHEMAIASVSEVYDGDTIIKASSVSRDEMDEFVSSLPLETYQKILDHVASSPALRYVITYTNSKGEEREIVLSNLTDFFRFR